MNVKTLLASFRQADKEMRGWIIAGARAQRDLLTEFLAAADPAKPKAPTAADQPEAKSTARRPQRKRRRMSPDARKRISQMMKKRWAERKKGK